MTRPKALASPSAAPRGKRGVPDQVENLLERYERMMVRANGRQGRKAVWLRMAIMKNVSLCDEVVDDEGHCACSRLTQELLKGVLELEG